METHYSMNNTHYGFLRHEHCFRCPCGESFELKFFTDLIVLPSIIEKEKDVASI